MEFADLVKYSFADQHMAIPKVITCAREAKSVRLGIQAIERKSRRLDAFDSKRIVIDSEPCTPEVAARSPRIKTDPRRKQMLQWKAERMRKKILEPKKPPPFIVGTVKHNLAPFQEPIFKATSKRVTRSATRAKMQESESTINKITIPQKSFAPPGAQFHAPKMLKQKMVEVKKKTVEDQPKKVQVKEKKMDVKTTNVRNLRQAKGNTKMNVSSRNEKNTNIQSDNKTVKLTSIVTGEEIEKVKDVTAEATPKRSKRKSVASEEPNSEPSAKTPKMDTDFLDTTGSGLSDFRVTSPFVTVGRGKNNSRRETLSKIQFGFSSEMSPKKSSHYLRVQLDGEISRLQGLCSQWRTYQLANDSTLDEDSKDLINLAIGQSQLLMSKKFEQFRGLIDQCENQETRDGEGAVTVQDLQGFWDMVYMQVVNIDLRFIRLTELEKNNWREFDVPVANKVVQKPATEKTKVNTKSVKPSIGLRAMIQAARERAKKSEDSETPKVKPLEKVDSNMVTFNGGFFAVVSPAKKEKTTSSIASPRRTSMLRNVVDTEAKKRISMMTPPSTDVIIKVATIGKSATKVYGKNLIVDNTKYAVAPLDFNKTPGKSILKTPGTSKIQNSPSKKKIVKITFNSEEESEQTNKRMTGTAMDDNTTISKDNFNSLQSEGNEVLRKNVSRKKKLTRQANVDESDENTPPIKEGKNKRKRGRKRKANIASDSIKCNDELKHISSTGISTEEDSKAAYTPRRSSRSGRLCSVNN